jgi:hypothetical protein
MITAAEDDVSISWASNRKNILLAGIVNPANFLKVKRYTISLHSGLDTKQSINQTFDFSFRLLFEVTRGLVAFSPSLI